MKTNITSALALLATCLIAIPIGWSTDARGATITLTSSDPVAKEPSWHISEPGNTASITVTRSTEPDLIFLECRVLLTWNYQLPNSCTWLPDYEYGRWVVIPMNESQVTISDFLVAYEDFEEEIDETVTIGVESVFLVFPSGKELPADEIYDPVTPLQFTIEDSLNGTIGLSGSTLGPAPVQCGNVAELDVSVNRTWNSPLTIHLNFSGSAAYGPDYYVEFVEANGAEGSLTIYANGTEADLTITATGNAYPANLGLVGVLRFHTICPPTGACTLVGDKNIEITYSTSPSPANTCAGNSSITIKGDTSGQPLPYVVIDSHNFVDCHTLRIVWHWVGQPPACYIVGAQYAEWPFGPWTSYPGGQANNAGVVLIPILGGHSYRLVVDPNCSGGSCGSIFSPPILVKFTPCTPQIVVGFDGEFAIGTWSPVLNAITYKVFRQVSGGSWQPLATTGPTVTSFSDRVQCGQTVCYKVTAVGTGGESPPATACVTGATCPPTTGYPYTGYGRIIPLKWTVYPGAISYAVTLQTPGGPAVTYQTGTDLEFAWEVESGLNEVTFQVTAILEEGPNPEAVAYAPLPMNLDIHHSVNVEFSTEANPPANSPWTFGHSTLLGLDFTPVTHFNPDSATDDGTLVPAWQLADGRSPAFWHNNSGHAVTVGNGTVTCHPGEFWMAPGDNGYAENYGVVRYTVPTGEGGLYRMAVHMQSFWMNAGWGDTDFHILHNGWEIYGNFLPTIISTDLDLKLHLAAGDTIDFVVGRGFDASQYGSVLKLAASFQATTPDPAGGTWTGADSLPASRYAHTATALPNGKVLVVGGDNGTALANAELYDPMAGTFSAAASMPSGRSRHTATLLPNGKVLIAGGYNGSALSSCVLYNPATDTWTAAAPMNGTRYVHTATLLPNGKVLIAGGYRTGAINGTELYDPATDTWTVKGNLNTPRYYHTATLLLNGKVLVAGAFGSGSAELYNPVTGNWTATGSMMEPRYVHTATLLPDGKVLATAGHSGSAPRKTAELYDPATGNWTLTGSLTTARYYHTATYLPTIGMVLVTGGYNNGSLNTAQLYDPGAGCWFNTGAKDMAGYFSTATWLSSNGKVLVTGGYGTSSYLTAAELYTP